MIFEFSSLSKSADQNNTQEIKHLQYYQILISLVLFLSLLFCLIKFIVNDNPIPTENYP